MEKYLSSNSHSGFINTKTFSNFNTLPLLSPKIKTKDNFGSPKQNNEKTFNFKNFTFRKDFMKAPTFLCSSIQKFLFKSLEKNHDQSLLGRKVSSFKFLQKKKDLTYRNNVQIKEQKQLRGSGSTKCQSPKEGMNQKLKISDFKKLRLIGTGKYGSVYMVKHQQTGFIAAMKIIRKIDIDCLQKEHKSKMINQIIRQIKIQTHLNHPNLINLYTYFTDQYNIYLLMELGCDGQLYDLMQKKNKFRQDTVAIALREILEGLSYMHKKQVIHRDIKPQNIVSIHGFAKICDFGSSVYNSKELRLTFCGTPLYLSPEILKGNMYNQKIDTWAIGILAYEMYTADNPFKIKKKEELSKIITQDFTMKFGSPQFRDFLASILKKDPAARPQSGKLLCHQFINKYKNIEASEEICSLVYRREVTLHKSFYK